jgi:hypothetical protein
MDNLELCRNALGEAVVRICKVAEDIAIGQGLMPNEVYPFVLAYLVEVLGADDGLRMVDVMEAG